MRNSQGSSSHQGLHIRGVNLQGFVVLVHGFDVAAVFEVGHTCAHAAKSGKDKQKNSGEQKVYSSQLKSISDECLPLPLQGPGRRLFLSDDGGKILLLKHVAVRSTEEEEEEERAQSDNIIH